MPKQIYDTPVKGQKSNAYFLLGSKDFSPSKNTALIARTAKLCNMGYTLRVCCFNSMEQVAYRSVPDFGKANNCRELYLPFDGFQGYYADKPNCFIADAKTRKWLYGLLPKDANQKMTKAYMAIAHAILGPDLETQVDFASALGNTNLSLFCKNVCAEYAIPFYNNEPVSLPSV